MASRPGPSEKPLEGSSEPQGQQSPASLPVGPYPLLSSRRGRSRCRRQSQTSRGSTRLAGREAHRLGHRYIVDFRLASVPEMPYSRLRSRPSSNFRSSSHLTPWKSVSPNMCSVPRSRLGHAAMRRNRLPFGLRISRDEMRCSTKSKMASCPPVTSRLSSRNTNAMVLSWVWSKNA